MNYEIVSYLTIIGLVVFGIVKNSLSFSPIQFQCDNYVLNTYLYFILSWAIVMSTNKGLSMANIKASDIFSGPLSIIFMLGSITLLMALLFIPPKYFFTKHVLYIALIMSLGLFLYPYYQSNKEMFIHVGITTFIMLVILTFIAFSFPKLIKNSWGIYLFIGLIGLIVARVVEMFITKKETRSKMSKIISYVAVVIFSLYVMYDTKKIIKHAKHCVNPDYINESISIFLDSLNLFQNFFLLSN